MNKTIIDTSENININPANVSIVGLFTFKSVPESINIKTRKSAKKKAVPADKRIKGVLSSFTKVFLSDITAGFTVSLPLLL